MNAQVDYRKMAESDLLDLARVFCSLKGYGSPTAMRYSLFIKKDGTVGDECFSYQRADAASFGVHLSRLRGLGLVGLCSVKVYSEGFRYYGLHLSVSDERFNLKASTSKSSPKDESIQQGESYYLPKVLRVMEDEAGHPDFRNIQLLRSSNP